MSEEDTPARVLAEAYLHAVQVTQEIQMQRFRLIADRIGDFYLSLIKAGLTADQAIEVIKETDLEDLGE